MPVTPAARELRFLESGCHRAARHHGAQGARREGFLSGLHRSPYKGFSVEFAEYASPCRRQYLRTQRPALRQAVSGRRTNLECHLLLDVSASMAYRGAAPLSPMSKLEYGAVLAGSLAFLMNRRRIATGLHGVQQPDGVAFPAASQCAARTLAQPAHRARAARARASLGCPRPLQQLAEALVRRSLVVLIWGTSVRQCGARRQWPQASQVTR